ncbi:MAG TPA: DUF4097 family beta strand repeat-containing protein [Candidatus Acidoferrum sp.]|nr:DUF4097 family beta strand repeat-containing protein [Candidatus Acidoferrum sp.]
MTQFRRLSVSLTLIASAALLAGCQIGPSVSGSFDRSLDVSGPIRLELSNVSGDVSITGSIDGKIHVHGDVQVSGFGFGSPSGRLNEILSSPPVELKGDTLRVGKSLSHLRSVSISYTVEVPKQTNVDASSVSGSETIRNVAGPVRAGSVSGSLRIQDVSGEVRLSSTSGNVEVNSCGDDVHATSVSGTVIVSGAKGDVFAHSVSGDVRVSAPGGRVDAASSSGSIEIRGANGDVQGRSGSGHLNVQGNPSGNSFWELHTVSGGVQIGVPANANFHFSAGAVSGEIRAQVPIMIEEQGKHSLRARMGTGGGRVEIHTVSGDIDLQAAQQGSASTTS